jgi:uncharacterized protein YdhG (YjbR/CyaY superfamily)
MRVTTKSVADYIAKTPPARRKALKALRALVRSAAPRATEKISYGIPTFVLNGTSLVYIAGWEDHLSMYPVTSGVTRKLKKEIARYQTGKGTLQFALADPLPKSLIKRIVKIRISEVAARAR